MDKWTDFPHATVPVVRARVEEIVRRSYGKTLEVGCNEGFVTKALQEKGLDVTALDNRDDALRITKQLWGIDAVKGDIYHLPFNSETFDTVIGGEILEHLENPGRGLAELFRVSKNGHVIITLPIGAYWLGEPTHAFEINGCVVEHDEGTICPYSKNVFVIEFNQRRKIVNGYYTAI